MTSTFKTFAPDVVFHQPAKETLVEGKIYRVKFAGEEVRARFLGTRNEESLSRGLRVAHAMRNWERV